MFRKKDEDAAAAAQFFVDKGGRKPVELLRNGGCCIAGENLNVVCRSGRCGQKHAEVQRRQ